MNGSLSLPDTIPAPLLAKVLDRLRIDPQSDASPAFLETIYAAWCRSVPFDNVRKMIHVQSGNPGPLPGGTAEDFFEAWLRHGTGSTCWPGANAFHALLIALGFHAERGIATMLVAPHLPPNHGTVVVKFGSDSWLVDGSILHGVPLQLRSDAETGVDHPAWGVRCTPSDDRWYIHWRPMHKVDGFDCRLESVGASGDDYRNRYDHTRGWSPFNYELNARANRGDEVVGMAFGKAVTLRSDGSVATAPLTPEERRRILIEDIGLSEEIVSQLPDDTPTPPPPGSATAAST